MKESSTSFTVVVWMVSYNQVAHIEQAVKSVVEQKTQFKTQLYVADDCSTDGTKDILQQYAKAYPDQIVLMDHSVHLGLPENAYRVYNKCLESDARYIAMLEGDDCWIDEFKLQKQVDFLEANPEYNLCFSRFKTENLFNNSISVDLNGHYFENGQDYIEFDFNTFQKGWYGGLPTLVFRNKIVAPDFFRKYNYFRDVHLFAELLQKGRGVCLNFFGSMYRIHENGIYSSASEFARLQTGSRSYGELSRMYPENNALRSKYRSFHRKYIDALRRQGRYFKSIYLSFGYSLATNDWAFTKGIIKLALRQIFPRKS